MATISDVKSHKAEATIASLGEIFGDGDVDLKSCKTLYIASDSPTSQYRNKNICNNDNAFDICWIYTEKGHEKGPMDGVGSAVKRVITDTIAYHHKSVIRNTEQLMAILPAMSVEVST